MKTISVYRWNPDEKGTRPKMQDYEIDLNECGDATGQGGRADAAE